MIIIKNWEQLAAFPYSVTVNLATPTLCGIPAVAADVHTYWANEQMF